MLPTTASNLSYAVIIALNTFQVQIHSSKDIHTRQLYTAHVGADLQYEEIYTTCTQHGDVRTAAVSCC